jgi:hypothetical protein
MHHHYYKYINKLNNYINEIINFCTIIQNKIRIGFKIYL